MCMASLCMRVGNDMVREGEHDAEPLRDGGLVLFPARRIESIEAANGLSLQYMGSKAVSFERLLCGFRLDRHVSTEILSKGLLEGWQ